MSGFAAAVLGCEALYALFLCSGVVEKWVVGRSEFEGLHLSDFAIYIGWTVLCFWVARSAVRLPREPSAAHRWRLLAMAALHLLLAVPLLDYQNQLIPYWLIAVGALLVLLGAQRVPSR
ncbi:hypothetical protein ASE03_10395 [Kitasatospora sp. Root187]|nr:hypothetical protein ASC99_15115 [Kitasatospora sp. Root107]KRB60769.1 hypothetical protein ASE03_10395 [Kitasatospora sp. Root187]